jgi:DNA-binding GntR family transcriptional regulator
MASSALEHERLVERMKKKDILGSVEVIRNHIQKARDQVIKILSAEEFGEVHFKRKFDRINRIDKIKIN